MVVMISTSVLRIRTFAKTELAKTCSEDIGKLLSPNTACKNILG